MAKSEEKEKCKLVTPEFRVSYPHLFKPTKMPGTNNAPKFSITMLFPKNANLKPLQQAMNQAKIAEFGEDKTKWPKVIESPVGDGDDADNSEKEGYSGHWVIRATTSEDQKPGVFDENVNEVMDAATIYPGCYARAHVFARVWKFGEGKPKYGVQFILDHVQKLRDGKSFSNRKAGTEVFSPVGASSEDASDTSEDTDFK